jgi:hypothetical protein
LWDLLPVLTVVSAVQQRWAAVAVAAQVGMVVVPEPAEMAVPQLGLKVVPLAR